MIWYEAVIQEITQLPGPDAPPDWFGHTILVGIGIVCFLIGFLSRGFFDE